MRARRPTDDRSRGNTQMLQILSAYSTQVTDVYSTKVDTIGGRQTTHKSDDKVPLAMIGIVPIMVTSENDPVHPDDLLMPSSRLGYSTKAADCGRSVDAVISMELGSCVFA